MSSNGGGWVRQSAQIKCPYCEEAFDVKAYLKAVEGESVELLMFIGFAIDGVVAPSMLRDSDAVL